ncbi:unnamed protein product [Cyprideis torosa]|uniref:Uncharacterized protein n=1 Tax=Cyprideis torosa TaxID=163714 RepID=A0A7R8W6U1_9CRUS|nr:unnamed protein product [Cyprideis torosa]CAG0886898.1 unnamed protein product [Cyprideis torosa]
MVASEDWQPLSVLIVKHRGTGLYVGITQASSLNDVDLWTDDFVQFFYEFKDIAVRATGAILLLGIGGLACFRLYKHLVRRHRRRISDNRRTSKSSINGHPTESDRFSSKSTSGSSPKRGLDDVSLQEDSFLVEGHYFGPESFSDSRRRSSSKFPDADWSLFSSDEESEREATSVSSRDGMRSSDGPRRRRRPPHHQRHSSHVKVRSSGHGQHPRFQDSTVEETLEENDFLEQLPSWFPRGRLPPDGAEADELGSNNGTAAGSNLFKQQLPSMTSSPDLFSTCHRLPPYIHHRPFLRESSVDSLASMLSDISSIDIPDLPQSSTVAYLTKIEDEVCNLRESCRTMDADIVTLKVCRRREKPAATNAGRVGENKPPPCRMTTGPPSEAAFTLTLVPPSSITRPPSEADTDSLPSLDWDDTGLSHDLQMTSELEGFPSDVLQPPGLPKQSAFIDEFDFLSTDEVPATTDDEFASSPVSTSSVSATERWSCPDGTSGEGCYDSDLTPPHPVEPDTLTSKHHEEQSAPQRVVPMIQVEQETRKKCRKTPFVLYAALDAAGKADGMLYWDSGDQMNEWETGSYNLLKFHAEEETLSSSVHYWGYKSPDPMTLGEVVIFGAVPAPSASSPWHAAREITGVTVNGRPVPFRTQKEVRMSIALICLPSH